MLKIIFLSPVHPLLTLGFPLPKWQMQSSWVRALQKAGADVKVVRYTPGGKARVNWGERVWANIRVIREIREIGGIDLIIYSLGADVLMPWTLRLIKWLTKAPMVILSGVSPVSDGNPRERAIAKFVDLAAVNDEGHAREWRKLGAKKAVVLPISGVDPELHFNKGPAFRRAKGRALKDIDVLFVGTVTPERREFLAELRKLLPETVKFVVKEFVWEEEYAGLMSRAKIVLNPIRPEMKNGANLRMFEIPAFGALELGSYGKKEWLMPGKEMLVYKDAEEAAELIVKYLKDGKKREEMVERGKGRVDREHTFEKRAEKLLEFIKMDSNKARPFASRKAGPLIDLTICIVNYKADKELKRCLDSIKKFTKGISFEVIVIDNSLDNKWYSGGNNLALARAKGKYILFLNPDCYLTYDILSKFVGWMDKHPKVGASEPRQIYDNGGIAPTGSLLPVWWVDGVELTILNKWAPKKFSQSYRPARNCVAVGGGPSEEIGRIFSWMMRFRQIDKDRGENWRTEVVSGAAMMVRKKVLEKVGGFDEKLKLYYTDVDLCRRILSAGFKIWHLGEFSLGHSTRKSTGKIKWDELYDIYAQDAWNYYRKWGEGVGGGVLFLAMRLNRLMVKTGKRLGGLGRLGR